MSAAPEVEVSQERLIDETTAVVKQQAFQMKRALVNSLSSGFATFPRKIVFTVLEMSHKDMT